LVPVLDWCSQYVVSWGVSITLDVGFCLKALEQALEVAQPEIFPPDHGTEVTSLPFTSRFAAAGIRIRMDCGGQALDNIFVERLWRSVKHEEVYGEPKTAVINLRQYFDYYSHRRLHQALDDQTPAEVYGGGLQKGLEFHSSGKPAIE
jgi:putative transposase